MIPQLADDPASPFPATSRALPKPDGLLAWGGDLHPQRLLNAYRQGIFPWFSEDDPILWWSPSERCLVPTSKVHISRRMRRTLRQQPFGLSMDTAFEQVVAGCSETRTSTWITEPMRAAYGNLHQLGYAHSIEVWCDDQLVGGLYGLALGRMFAGESMFCRQRDASKIALITLCRALSHWGYAFLDAQMSTPHLLRMGGETLTREVFEQRLKQCMEHADERGHWHERFERFQSDGINW